MKIYTKTGDRGETKLFDGTPVSKDELRVDAYGDLDELNSVVGCAVVYSKDKTITLLLTEIQRQLFSLGAELADPKSDERAAKKPQLCKAWVEELEKEIDDLSVELPPLNAFILPGGCPCAAWLHLARTVCRRAERRVVHAARHVKVKPLVVVYLNRLSDFLFVLARVANHREDKEELEW